MRENINITDLVVNNHFTQCLTSFPGIRFLLISLVSLLYKTCTVRRVKYRCVPGVSISACPLIIQAS